MSIVVSHAWVDQIESGGGPGTAKVNCMDTCCSGMGFWRKQYNFCRNGLQSATEHCVEWAEGSRLPKVQKWKFMFPLHQEPGFELGFDHWGYRYNLSPWLKFWGTLLFLGGTDKLIFIQQFFFTLWLYVWLYRQANKNIFLPDPGNTRKVMQTRKVKLLGSRLFSCHI